MNKHWRVAFCGLGSIGSRHLRNLTQILNDRKETYEIDWIQHKDRSIPNEFKEIIRNVYKYDDTLPVGYDVIFITSPTYLHREMIEKMLAENNGVLKTSEVVAAGISKEKHQVASGLDTFPALRYNPY